MRRTYSYKQSFQVLAVLFVIWLIISTIRILTGHQDTQPSTSTPSQVSTSTTSAPAPTGGYQPLDWEHVQIDFPAPLYTSSGTPPAQAPVSTYWTIPIKIDFAIIRKEARESYWKSRLLQTFDVALDPPLYESNRLTGRAAEWFFAALFALADPDAQGTVFALIPALPGPHGLPAILVELKFVQRSGQKTRVDVYRIAEAPTFAINKWHSLDENNGYQIAVRGWGCPPDVWTQHPHWQKDFTDWNSRQSSLVTTANVLMLDQNGTGCFYVWNDPKRGGELNARWLGETAPRTLDPKSLTDVLDRDWGDFQLEQFATPNTDPAKRRLASAAGFEDLPEPVRATAKLVLTQYLLQSAHDCEIRVRVPLATTTGDRLCGFHLQNGAEPGTTDVLVEDFGPAAPLSSPYELSAMQIPDLAAVANDAAALKQAWSVRYPGTPVTGETTADLLATMDAELGQADHPQWFAANYGIRILDADAALPRLRLDYRLPDEKLRGLKEFTRNELLEVERALELLPVPMLAKLRGVDMARQGEAFETRAVTHGGKIAGLTHTLKRGGQLTDVAIVIYDQANLGGGGLLYVGDKDGLVPFIVATSVHEFGHVLRAAGMENGFNDEISVASCAPITWYSATNPNDEFFPEAFMLWRISPEWLRSNRPEVADWFVNKL